MTGTVVTGNALGVHGENLSIMIPTYNCAAYLRETLQSLQDQGDTIRGAQIEVVDDCSTKDDPERVIQEMWGDRVSFWRHPKNGGATSNFNMCLQRATRGWIYILHGDDIALHGAIDEIGHCLQQYPDADAVFGRAVFMDADARWQGVSDILGPGMRGVYQFNVLDWSHNPLQFSGVSVSRRAIDRVGGFDPTFGHVADWNLWWRIASSSTVAYTNRSVGGYRIFEGNHSSTLRRTARDLEERMEQTRRMAATVTDVQIRDRLFFELFEAATNRCEEYAKRGDNEALQAHVRIYSALGASARIPKRHRLRKAWLSVSGLLPTKNG